MNLVFKVINLAVVVLVFGEFNRFCAAEDSNVAGRVISVSGTVLLRTGDSLNQKNGVKMAPKAEQMKSGTTFHTGDVINTSSGGTVKLLFDDKSIIDVGASTLFHVKAFDHANGNDRNVDLTMVYGTVRAAVTRPVEGKGKFRIRTPTATMGVRGTEFIVTAGENSGKGMGIGELKNLVGGKSAGTFQTKTEIVVVQGRVDVDAPKPRSIDPKNMTRALASAGNSPGVVSLTAGQKLVADTSVATPPVPVTLTGDQMKQAVQTAKLEDNTFKKAIVIEVNNGNGNQGNGTQSGAPKTPDPTVGMATKAIVKDTMAAATAPAATTANATPVTSTNSGYIGTFGNDSALAPAPVSLLAGGLKKVRVQVTR